MDGSPYLRGSRRIQDRGLDTVWDGDVFAADTVTVEENWRESKGTLLTYRNNFVRGFIKWLCWQKTSSRRSVKPG